MNFYNSFSPSYPSDVCLKNPEITRQGIQYPKTFTWFTLILNFLVSPLEMFFGDEKKELFNKISTKAAIEKVMDIGVEKDVWIVWIVSMIVFSVVISFRLLYKFTQREKAPEQKDGPSKLKLVISAIAVLLLSIGPALSFVVENFAAVNITPTSGISLKNDYSTENFISDLYCRFGKHVKEPLRQVKPFIEGFATSSLKLCKNVERLDYRKTLIGLDMKTLSDKIDNVNIVLVRLNELKQEPGHAQIPIDEAIGISEAIKKDMEDMHQKMTDLYEETYDLWKRVSNEREQIIKEIIDPYEEKLETLPMIIEKIGEVVVSLQDAFRHALKPIHILTNRAEIALKVSEKEFIAPFYQIIYLLMYFSIIISLLFGIVAIALLSMKNHTNDSIYDIKSKSQKFISGAHIIHSFCVIGIAICSSYALYHSLDITSYCKTLYETNGSGGKSDFYGEGEVNMQITGFKGAEKNFSFSQWITITSLYNESELDTPLSDLWATYVSPSVIVASILNVTSNAPFFSVRFESNEDFLSNFQKSNFTFDQLQWSPFTNASEQTEEFSGLIARIENELKDTTFYTSLNETIKSCPPISIQESDLTFPRYYYDNGYHDYNDLASLFEDYMTSFDKIYNTAHLYNAYMDSGRLFCGWWQPKVAGLWFMGLILIALIVLSNYVFLEMYSFFHDHPDNLFVDELPMGDAAFSNVAFGY